MTTQQKNENQIQNFNNNQNIQISPTQQINFIYEDLSLYTEVDKYFKLVSKDTPKFIVTFFYLIIKEYQIHKNYDKIMKENSTNYTNYQNSLDKLEFESGFIKQYINKETSEINLSNVWHIIRSLRIEKYQVDITYLYNRFFKKDRTIYDYKYDKNDYIEEFKYTNEIKALHNYLKNYKIFYEHDFYSKIARRLTWDIETFLTKHDSE